MHSTNIMYTDPYPRPTDPPRGGPESFTFHHNGDFSGDAKLNIEGWRVTKIYEADSQWARHGQAIYEIEIPFEVLAKLVAEAVLQKRIEDLEGAKYKEILGL